MNKTPVQKSQYTLRPGESDRIQILKFWFCIMVVFIHANFSHGINFNDGTVLFQIPEWLAWAMRCISNGLCRCAVPAFFMISALLLYRKEFSWTSNLKKKLRSILLPYLFLNTFWIAAYFIAQKLPFTRAFFAEPANMVANWDALDWLNAYVGFDETRTTSPFLYTLWFLRDLMVLNLLASLLKRVMDRFPKAVLCILAAMLVLNVDTHIPVLSSQSLIFFCFGYYLVKYDLHISDLDKLPLPLLAASYALSFGLYALATEHPLQPQVGILRICLGILFFFRLSAFAAGRRSSASLKLAKYNFSIYLFHEVSLSFLIKLATRFLPRTAPFQAMTYFVLPWFVIALCIAVSMFLERFEPRFYALLTGGRAR